MFAATSPRIRTPLHSFVSFSYRFSASGTPFLRIVLDRIRDERGRFARPLTYRCETPSSFFPFFLFFSSFSKRSNEGNPSIRANDSKSIICHLAFSRSRVLLRFDFFRESSLFLDFTQRKKKSSRFESRRFFVSPFHLFKFVLCSRTFRTCRWGR